MNLMLPSTRPCNPERVSRRLLHFGSIAIGICAASLASAQLKTVPDKVLDVIQRSKLVSHADPGQVVHVNVCLEVPDPAALQGYSDEVSNPNGPLYRHFLTPSQVGQKFGQSASVLNSVAQYLKSQGFKLTLVANDRLHIMAEGTVKQAESAFNTAINKYHANSASEPGRTDYFAYSKQPQVPAALAGSIQHVAGLENFQKPKGLTTLTPAQTHVLYNTSPEVAGQLYGQGRTLAISNWDGYRLSNVPIYYKDYSLPTPSGGVGSNITVVTIDGGSGAGTPGGEGDLDIQMVLGQAPLCNFLIYDGGGGLTDVLTREANDNLADAISESYGWILDAGTASAAHTLHLEMTAEGITYMHATGDSGTSLEPYSYPDYEPEALGVGGSSAQTDAQGNRQSEVAWDGGGGGWSTNSASFNVHPSWQKATGVPNINFRLQPDVSAHASGDQVGFTGAYYFVYNGTLQAPGIGTSFASPIFCGDLGIAEQKVISLGGLPKDGNGHRRFGRINDLFYSQNMRSDVWFDITVGNTGTLPNGQQANAGKGWDFCSGLGAINWDAFAHSVATPPQSVDPVSASIYTDPVAGALGTSPTGNYTNLYAEDGRYYTVNSVTQPAGQTAAAVVGFNLSTSPNFPTLMTLNLALEAPQGTTVFIYEFTNSGGGYTLNPNPISTLSMNGTDQAVAITFPNPAAVSNGNQFKFVARALYPARFGNTPFTFKLDEAIVSENF